MKKKILILITIIICSILNIQAQKTEWTLTSSVITFKIKNAGISVKGSFSELKTSIFFDASKLVGNEIAATVETKTINTGNNSRDTHLKKEEYFGVDKNPTISLKSIYINKLGYGNFEGKFLLTIKNTSKEVTIPFKFSEKDQNATFKGTFTIDRLDYKVGESSLILSDNVTISLLINVAKK